MTRIKICGLKDKAHALAAVDTGADFIGLVFAPSPRQITLSRAYEIASAVKQASHHVQVVGVFVDTPSSAVNQIADTCGLDWVQLSGDETWAYCRQIKRPIIKAIRVGKGQLAQKASLILANGAKELSNRQHLFLLDSEVKGKYGGTGLTFDWRLARPLTETFQIIIAGGLAPENVGQAVELVAPWGVDVSSGVETEGVKDVAKIKAFIEVVRRLDASRN